MSDVTHYLCIGCPLGCRLEVEEDQTGSVVEVRGHSCRKGKTFAEREHHDPRRMVTSTISVRVAAGHGFRSTPRPRCPRISYTMSSGACAPSR